MPPKGRKPKRRTGHTPGVTPSVAKYTLSRIDASKSQKQIRFVNSFAHNTNVVASAMYNVSLTNIGNGDQLFEKIGSSVKISSIHIRMVFGNAGATARALRIMVLRAKNPADAPDLTGYTDLYEDAAFGAAAPTAISIDGVRHINRDVYKVYWDKTYPIGSQSTMKSLYINKWIKLNRKVTYGTPSSNTANNGRIFLIYNLLNTDSVNDPTACRITHTTTVYFKDA